MAVWIQGQPNTGKTCITKMIDEIFICDVMQEGESHFHLKVKDLTFAP